MNTIAERIFDFLKQFPPFNVLNKSQLLEVSKSIDIIYLQKDETLFDVGESVKKYFYVVKDGAIGLYRQDLTAVDHCDEGDIFGLRALLRKGEYKLRATAIEECIIYSISSQIFDEYIASNLDASQFLMSSFISNTNPSYREEYGSSKSAILSNDLTELQSADYSKDPITCHQETTVKEATLIMTKNRVGSIIIVKHKKPIGIITDKDLRTKIATGKHSISEPVTTIMSSPVIAYSESITVAEAQLAMLKHKITHLCITKDGTTASELTGILSEHDIIVLRENNASSLFKEIKRSANINSLKSIRERAEKLISGYINQNIPIDFIATIISTINEAITQKLIELSIVEMDAKPPCTFAWLSIGSQGRHEQLLLTDQDNALIFDNVEEKKLETTKTYFLKLANKVNKGLAVIGFELCPAKMMANNPKWCMSLNQWKKQFHGWITSPDQENLMLCTIFFDFEHVYGNSQLVEELSDSIFQSIEKYDVFLNYLGRNALQNPPPLSFFRQFLVEESGEHKDQFDIKARAMMPLVDAARLLILSHQIKSINNTLSRYEKLVELEPQNKDTYQFCIEAFKDLLFFRTENGLLNQNSGRFIDLKSLSKANRLKLKRSFKAVKMVQELIQVRFKLSHLM